MKKSFLIWLLMLAFIFTGCASQPDTQGFIRTADGYAMQDAPFGCSVDALEEALGCSMTERESLWSSYPYEFDDYVTEAEAAEFFGLKGKVDAQFTSSGLYAVTFTAKGSSDEMDAAYKSVWEAFQSAFGSPTSSDAAADTESARWVDEKTNTQLMIQLTASDEQNQLFKFGVVDLTTLQNG